MLELLTIEEPKLVGSTYINISTLHEGDPFVFDEWYPGIIYLNRGDRVKVPMLNYDANIDEFVYIHPVTGKWIKLDKFFIKQIDILQPDNKTLHFINMSVKDSVRLTGNYYEELYRGPHGLYRKYNCQLESNSSKQEGNRYVSFSFKHSEEYVLVQSKNSLKINLKPSTLYDLFPEQKRILKAYIRGNNLQVKFWEDFVGVLKYVDENPAEF